MDPFAGHTAPLVSGPFDHTGPSVAGPLVLVVEGLGNVGCIVVQAREGIVVGFVSFCDCGGRGRR